MELHVKISSTSCHFCVQYIRVCEKLLYMKKYLFVVFSPQEKIRWHDVTRILVYTSDDTFHMAGDGRLGGVFQPHNGQCHLNEKGSYNGKAYVSVAHLMMNVLYAFSVIDKRKKE